MYISYYGIPPWIFSHYNTADLELLLSIFSTVVGSPILPVHSLELAVLLAFPTMPCRVLPPNCKVFQCGGQEQEQLVNTAPPQLPELRLHKFSCGPAASFKVDMPFKLPFCRCFMIIR